MMRTKVKAVGIISSTLYATLTLGSQQTAFVTVLAPTSFRFHTPTSRHTHTKQHGYSAVSLHTSCLFESRSRRAERVPSPHHITFAARNSIDGTADKVTTKTKKKSSSARVGKKVKSSKGTESDTSSLPDAISDRVRVKLKDLATNTNKASLKGSEESTKDRLARAAATILAQRKEQELDKSAPKYKRLSFASMSAAKAAGAKKNNPSWAPQFLDDDEENAQEEDSQNLIQLMQKINQKILRNNWSRSGQQRPRGVNENNLYDGPNVHTQHSTDSMQSLLGYNHFEGEWSDRNATTYHVAIVFGKPLIQDQVTVEYATRIRTLAKLLKEEPLFRPKLICFTGGRGEGNTISDASAGYVYFRHLCAAQNITIDSLATKIWVDTKSSNEREAMERIASELWRNHIKQWLSERPLTERINQHYGVGWKILERKVDIHFTLVSTEYHLCNLNDVHHRSPVKSFLQPLVSLRGLVGSDRWANSQELEVMDPSYSSSVHVRGSDKAPLVSDRATFGGIENSVDTSWSFQYGTYPFLHGDEESIVFLGQCYLLGEELTPLLVNMKGVVEQTEFFQRDNYYLLSSIRRSLVSLVEALYTEKGQSIRLGVIKHFERQGRNRFTKEDVKIIVVLESALLNLGRCIDLVKPAGLLVSSVPATTWSRALDALQKSMNHIHTVCDPDQPLEPVEWGKLLDEEESIIHLSLSQLDNLT